jgi:F-type H+-transporting ATPase subunit delta
VRDSTVARSYADALFDIARKTGEEMTFARAFEALDRVLASDVRVRNFLATPKIDVAAKKHTLRAALQGKVPTLFLNFLMVVLDKRRQRILREMSIEYHSLVDEHLGRLNVRVTLAHEPDERAEEDITAELSRILGRKVVSHIEIDPGIVGGIVVRYGDRILDASLRRRLLNLRERLLISAGPVVV